MEKWSGINQHTIQVFNRWGEKVWESNNFPQGWDGKKNGKFVAEGTYFWVLEIKIGQNNIQRKYKGSLTIMGAS
jgi:gliding motility-associated-like protein